MNQHELAQIFVRANEFKEGDLLVGGTRDELERKEARQMLSRLRLKDITETGLVEDSLSDALARSLDPQLTAEISHLSVGEMKRIVLGPDGVGWHQSLDIGSVRLTERHLHSDPPTAAELEACAEAVRALLGPGSRSVGDLPGLDEADQLVLVRRLLREGVLIPASHP